MNRVYQELASEAMHKVRRIWPQFLKSLGGPCHTTHNDGMTSPAVSVIEEARKAGFDLNLIEMNLLLTPEERWRQHDMALEVILELEKARMARDAGLQETPRATR
jgi:hypothetical protein